MPVVKRKGFLARRFLYILIFACFLPSYIYELNGAVHRISQVLRLVGDLTAFILLYKGRRIPSYVRAITLYIVFTAVLTAAYQGGSGLSRFITIYPDMFAVTVLTDHLIKREPRHFISIMYHVLIIGLVLNALSILVFPDGMFKMSAQTGYVYPVYLYGYDNTYITKYLITIVVVYFYEEQLPTAKSSGKHLRCLAVIVVCFLTAIVLKSIAMICALFLLLVGFFVRNRINGTSFAFTKIWALFCAASLLIITVSTSPLFQDILNRIGKVHSFSLRVSIWSGSLQAFLEKPIIGIGVPSTWTMRDICGYASTHNSFLNVLLWGGIAGALIYSYFILCVDKSLDGTKSVDDKVFLSMVYVSLLAASMFTSLELSCECYVVYSLIANEGIFEKTYANSTSNFRSIHSFVDCVGNIGVSPGTAL